MKLEKLSSILQSEFDSDSLVFIDDEYFCYNIGFDKNIIEDIRNHEMQIFTGYYRWEDGWKSPKIYLIGRGKKSGKFKFKIQNFKPYCYLKNEVGDYKTYLGETVEKMIFESHPAKIKFFREMRRRQHRTIPYESDVLFIRRILCDTYDYFKSKKAIKPKTAIVDVETNFPVDDNIIAWAINDMEGPILYESKFDTPNLSILALNLFEKLNKYDWMVGWNIAFDQEKIEEMLEEIKHIIDIIEVEKLSLPDAKNHILKRVLKVPITDRVELLAELLSRKYLIEEDGIIKSGKFLPTKLSDNMTVVDMIGISKKMYAKEIRGNWSLGNVGKRICGIDKIHLGATKIKDLNEEDLMNYNVRDTIICDVIDNTLGGLEGLLILAWSLQAMPNECILTAIVSDVALLRAYHKAGIVLPTRDYTKKSTKDKKYKAAEPDARPGVYKNIIATDVVHSYPSAVISKNISAETKDPNGVNKTPPTPLCPNGLSFNNNKSVFIETLKELINERTKIKKILSKLDKESSKWKHYKSIDFAVKTQAAAFSHGIFGWANSRMVDIEVADAITAIARELLNKIKEATDTIGRKWIYAHSDSVFINAPEEEKEKILSYLNNIIEDYSGDSIITPELDFQEFYKIGYVHTPARNVLLTKDADIDDVETWNTTGMNFARSEVSEPLANIEIKQIAMKLKGELEEDRMKQLKEDIKDIINVESQELATIKPYKKAIREYGKIKKDGSWGGIPYHIKSLQRAIDEYGFSISIGEKFGMLPIITEETIGVRVIKRKKVFMAFDIETGLPDDYTIDYEHYLRSSLFGKINKLFDMTAKDLEKEVLDDDVRAALFAGII